MEDKVFDITFTCRAYVSAKDADSALNKLTDEMSDKEFLDAIWSYENYEVKEHINY